MRDLQIGYFLNAALFALLGIAIFGLSLTFLAKGAPQPLWKEILEKQNMALAVLSGAVAIALALIIAAAMH